MALNGREQLANAIATGKIKTDDLFICTGCRQVSHYAVGEEASKMPVTECPRCGNIGFERAST